MMNINDFILSFAKAIKADSFFENIKITGITTILAANKIADKIFCLLIILYPPKI